jgi:hypothetical protein
MRSKVAKIELAGLLSKRPGAMTEFEDLGLCPCGQKIGANTQFYAVAHGVPECSEFRTMEPDEFLAYVRRSRGITDIEASDG